jgi:hypothetical protein
MMSEKHQFLTKKQSNIDKIIFFTKEIVTIGCALENHCQILESPLNNNISIKMIIAYALNSIIVALHGKVDTCDVSDEPSPSVANNTLRLVLKFQ